MGTPQATGEICFRSLFGEQRAVKQRPGEGSRLVLVHFCLLILVGSCYVLLFSRHFLVQKLVLVGLCGVKKKSPRDH